MLVLKVRYPSFLEKSNNQVQVLRTFRFSSSMTVEEAVLKVTERGGLDLSVGTKYGFFIPSYASSNVVGWLPFDRTFEALGISTGDEIDFRQRIGRKVKVWDGKMEASGAFEWNDEQTVKQNLLQVGRHFGEKKMLHVMPPNINRRVVILNKNDLLLNYSVGEGSEFVFSVQEGWKYSPEVTDEEILENVFFFVKTPYLEGEIWKKVATGFRRGWKKLWCVLQKETLSLYADPSSQTPVGGVHIRNMEFCYQSEAIDAQSKKLGHIFKLGTTGHEKVMYMGSSEKGLTARWVNTISEWISFAEFFRPKAITERGFALSHILSGQIRPNPKTHPGENLPPDAGQTGAGNAGSSSVSGTRNSGAALSQRQSVLDDVSALTTTGLEVQPNREITVVLEGGIVREMVVDSRLDVYELAYMIAEEIGSENAFIISPEDFGPHRTVELIDHQASLASQQIPLSAKFSIRKTGIVDDFVKECDIYDNHFLFVNLPVMEGVVLIMDEKGAWQLITMVMFGGKLCAMDPNDSEVLAGVIPMRSILSIYHSTSVLPQYEDYAFTIQLTEDREMHFLASTPDDCDDWVDLDGWCGFRCNSALMDPTDDFSQKLHEFGTPVENVSQFLNVVDTGGVESPRTGEEKGMSSSAGGSLVESGDDDMVEPPPSPAPSPAPAASDSTSASALESSPAVAPIPVAASPSLGSSGDSVGSLKVKNVKQQSSEDVPPAASSPLSASGKQRIKQFDWRKGSQQMGGKAGRRRSVEELFIDANSDEEGQEIDLTEEESAALRVPSDDESSFEYSSTKTTSVAEDGEEDFSGGSRPVSMGKSSSDESGRRKTPLPISDVAMKAALANTERASGSSPSSTSITPTGIPASGSRPQPQHDVSRQIRRAYESIEPVKLKALPDNDPSLYAWKVLHSVNLQKLGYASAKSEEVIFFDLRGHEVLRVLNADLPGLSVPASRVARVEATLKQMRKSSKMDVRSELRAIYDTDAIKLRRARDAEFEFRVVFSDNGEQVGWASKKGLDTVMYDINGKALKSFPSEMFGPAFMESHTAARITPGDVRALFKTDKEVIVSKASSPHALYDFQVTFGDGTHLGWAELEAFDFEFMDLQGRVLGRIPLVALPPQLKALVEKSKGAEKKRSSSGASTRFGGLGTLLNRSSSASSVGSGNGGGSGGDGPKPGGRPLSGWQLKMRGSGPFKPQSQLSPRSESSPNMGNIERKRTVSVDYTPDGLSPGLQDSVVEYDPTSSHKPMGLAGLLGEPEDSDDD